MVERHKGNFSPELVSAIETRPRDSFTASSGKRTKLWVTISLSDLLPASKPGADGCGAKRQARNQAERGRLRNSDRHHLLRKCDARATGERDLVAEVNGLAWSDWIRAGIKNRPFVFAAGKHGLLNRSDRPIAGQRDILRERGESEWFGHVHIDSIASPRKASIIIHRAVERQRRI